MTDEVRRDAELPAEPDEVWRAMTEMGDPGGWLGEIERIELEPGGDLAVTTPDGERREGWVEAVEPHRRPTFWWSTRDEEPSRVELELEPCVTGTRISVLEARPLRQLVADLVELPYGGNQPGSGPFAMAC